MKFALVMAGLFLVALAAYGLDRGIFVGSDRVLMGAPCCPDQDYIQKRCHYLFVTGVSTIDARDGRIMIDSLLSEAISKLKQAGFSGQEISDWAAKERGRPLAELLRRRPDLDNGYCRLFGD